jgi:hypothetical protein
MQIYIRFFINIVYKFVYRKIYICIQHTAHNASGMRNKMHLIDNIPNKYQL